MKFYPFNRKEKKTLKLLIVLDLLCLCLALYVLEPTLLFTSIAYYFVTNNGKAERMKERNKRA